MNAEFKPKIAAAAGREESPAQALEREVALLRLQGSLQALYLLASARTNKIEDISIPAEALSWLFELLADEAKRACPL